MKITRLWVLAVAGILLMSTAAMAQEVVTLLEGLTNPCGVAVQKSTGHVFVSDSGAGRVIRVVDGKLEEVIVGFPQDVYGKGPMVNIGPLGLLFMDDKTLVVGGGGLPDGEELLRVYTIPDAGMPAIKADNMVASFKLPADESEGIVGEGNFYALARIGDYIYVTCNGDDTKGWVARATIRNGKITKFERFLATKEATDVDAPVGLGVSPQRELVVAQMGEVTVPGDSLITYYEPGGQLLMNIETGLHDIAEIAFHPTSKNLYAVDYHWPNGDEGGLFRLDASKKGNEQVIKAVKIADLVRPTAMSFTADGTLYITVLGKPENEPSGSLVSVKVE